MRSLREFVWAQGREEWPRGARNGGPKLLIVGWGRPASAALKRYVFQDSMRAPSCRTSLAHFFRKIGTPRSRVVDKFLNFATRLKWESFFCGLWPPFECQLWYFYKHVFHQRGVVKITPVIFIRVLEARMSPRTCIISRVWAHEFQTEGEVLVTLSCSC